MLNRGSVKSETKLVITRRFVKFSVSQYPNYTGLFFARFMLVSGEN